MVKLKTFEMWICRLGYKNFVWIQDASIENKYHFGNAA